MVKNPHYRRTGHRLFGGPAQRLPPRRWQHCAGRTQSAGALGRRFRRLRLLIVGAGDVGGRVAQLVSQRFGDRIALIATSRRDDQRAALRRLGARTLATELDQRRAAQRLGCFGRWMIHLAPPPASGADDPRSRHLIAALGRNLALLPAAFGNGRACVYASTTGVYGDSGGAQFDETRAVNPQSERATRRVAAEQHWRGAARNGVAQGAGRTAIIRVPGIYGQNRLPIDRLQRGLPALHADQDVYTNHIHADDLARIVWLALFRGRPNRVYHAVDESDMKMGDYFDAVADAVGLPRPPRLEREQLKRAVSPAMWSFMQESRRLLNTRLRTELRFTLRFPTVADALARQPDGGLR